MFSSTRVFVLCSLFYYAFCSPSPPSTTPPAVLQPRTLDNDPAFRGYTSTNGSYSALYCLGDYTFTTFGNIADCCSVGGGLCHPATDCSTDYEGTTRVVKYQGGDFANCIMTNCATATIYNTMGDPRPKSIYGCFAPGVLYLTTPGTPASSTSGSAVPSNAPQSSQPTNSSSPSAAPAKKPTHNIGLIAGGVAIGVFLVLAVVALSIWVCMLQRKNKDPKPTTNTELQKMQAAGKTDTPTGGFKAELPTNEGWAHELPPESAPPSRHGEQKPWSGLNGGGMPLIPAPVHSPAPPYSGGPPSAVSPFADGAGGYYGGPDGGMAELPGQRNHQELPGSGRPQYAELG